MGDHVCGSTAAAAEPAPAPSSDLLGGALFSSLRANVLDKFRTAPPAVDTSAANRAFTRHGQLTPLSASTGSQGISPKTPAGGRPGAGTTGDGFFAQPIPNSPRRPGGYGGFGESGSYEGESTYGYGTSPNKSTNFLTRMNTIAPGPFESNRRPGARNAFARSNSRDQNAESNDDSLQVGSTLERPGTAGSTSSNGGSLAPPPRAPRTNGYGGFGPPQMDGDEFEPQPLGLGKRSETFPEKLLQANDEAPDTPARAPSAPGPRPDRLRSASNTTDALRPPPRTSLIRPPTQDGTRRPSINLANEFGVGNPYHSPSVSQSSSNSGYSHMSRPSQASSSTSPARSVGSRLGARRPSDMSNFNSLMDDLQSSMDETKLNGQPPSPGDRPVSRNRRAPPEGLLLDPANIGGWDSRLNSPMKSPLSPRSPLDRRDPAIQDPAVQGGPNRTPPTQSVHARQPSKDPRSRGNCKACKDPITGKSISSADGRLTGRYHKACFVCTTCKEPFSSSTFYVINDQPYCEQHYHKLNGSLCGSCGRGIEGQYLEDESTKKYHPRCFRCGDCGIVLRDGYFDVDGRAFCERDAWRRMNAVIQNQRPPPPNMQGYPGRRPSGQGPQMPRGPPGGPGYMGPGPKTPGPLNRPFGLPTGNRLIPGQALGRGGLTPMPKMEKRMTRLGMM